jgi:hypothetical protein
MKGNSPEFQRILKKDSERERQKSFALLSPANPCQLIYGAKKTLKPGFAILSS